MVDEHYNYLQAINNAKTMDGPLATELMRRHMMRDAINRNIAFCLRQTTRLSSFSGKFEVGTHIGKGGRVRDVSLLPRWAIESDLTFESTEDDEEGENEEEDDVAIEQETQNIIDFLDNLEIDS